MNHHFRTILPRPFPTSTGIKVEVVVVVVVWAPCRAMYDLD